MKKYIYTLLSIVAFAFTSCDDILDRPQLNTPTDGTYWKTEMDARLFANGFYRNFFVGYADTWGVAYTPLRGQTFSDDLTSEGKQESFSNSVPNSLGSSSTADLHGYQEQYNPHPNPLSLHLNMVVPAGIFHGYVKQTYSWNV